MKLLVTGAWNDAQSHFAELREMGHEVYWMPDERGALPVSCDDVEGVICNGFFLYHTLEEFPALRLIQVTSAGLDRVPVEEAERQGIKIYNARGVYSVPMAEFAICGVLQLYKQSRFFLRNQEAHRWEKHRGLLELSGKTVCILGIGSVGTACAERFRAFGCRILGVNIRPRASAYFDRVYGMDSLDEALEQSDVVILALPLTDETRGLFNQERFQAMKLNAILVNLARGAIVDTAALLDALDSHLGGAVLDVFDQEPLPSDSLLWTKDNVLVTPHNSFVGEGNRVRLTQVIMNNLAEFEG